MKKQIEVLRFDEFVNEEFKFSGLRNWTIIFLALFYNFKGDVPRKFNEPKFVENYVKNLPKLNNNQRVRDIISEVKNRVLKDTKISCLFDIFVSFNTLSFTSLIISLTL